MRSADRIHLLRMHLLDLLDLPARLFARCSLSAGLEWAFELVVCLPVCSFAQCYVPLFLCVCVCVSERASVIRARLPLDRFEPALKFSFLLASISPLARRMQRQRRESWSRFPASWRSLHVWPMIDMVSYGLHTQRTQVQRISAEFIKLPARWRAGLTRGRASASFHVEPRQKQETRSHQPFYGSRAPSVCLYAFRPLSLSLDVSSAEL